MCAGRGFASEASACDWDANLALGAHATRPSAGFQVSWSTASDCGSFTLDHYRVVINDTATPTSITDGEGWNVAAGTTTVSTIVNRAQRTFYGKVWACDTANCLDVYGSGVGENVTDSTASAATVQEKWVLTSVVDRSDGSVIVNSAYATSASAFFYPTGWSRAGQMALYYSDSFDIKFMYVTSAAGWVDFNDSSLWSTPATVASPHDNNLNYASTSHPTAMPVTDGSSNYVWMLAQNDGAAGYDHIVSVNSTDDEGDDFGLYCGNCCDGVAAGECNWPAFGTVEICADSTSTCDYLEQALHSRPVWPWVAEPVIDLTADSPQLLFMSSNDGTTCVDAGVGQADISLAEWNTGTQSWDVALTAGCPTEQLADHHDPGVTGLPDGSYRVYVMDGSSAVETHYLDVLGAWESQVATPIFCLDDGSCTLQVSHDCINDVDVFTSVVSGTPRTGMFMKVKSTGSSGCTDGVNQTGLYFAEKSN